MSAEARKRFNEQQEDINQRANEMLEICVHSQYDPITGEYIKDDKARIARIPEVVANYPMFESLNDEHKMLVVSGMQSAVREYAEIHNEYPRHDILASAHAAMKNMLLLEGRASTGSNAAMMLESIGTSLDTNSDGVEIRARMVGVVLPVLLGTATIDAVTMIPAKNDEVEIFKIYRNAANSFGDFAAGDEIDQLSVGQYTAMRQRYPFVDDQQPDGSIKEYVFTSATDLENTDFEIPFNKGSVSLFINHKRVCRDLDTALSGKMMGTHDGQEVVASIDYTTGVITVKTATALPDHTKLHAEFEVDIERRPDLIPAIEYEMEGRKIRPYQRAIAADATIQSMFTMQREYGIDLKSMQQSHLRNLIAAEKSQHHLRDMDFACTRVSTFNIYVAPGEDWRVHRQRLQETLLNVSEAILKSTKVVGMTGLYAGRSASTVLKTLGAPDFVAPANYRQTNDIHYAGKLFGVWKVFEAPVVIGDWEMLCYGRGPSHSESGYVAGDAIPATLYTHPILPGLRARDTLYELTYGEIHPYEGENYFYRVRIFDEEPIADAA